MALPAAVVVETERLRVLSLLKDNSFICQAQSFVERHRLQLVHDPRARLHHPMPMPQQLSQIAILPARNPDLRKIIFQHQAQNQLRILAIRLLLTHPFRVDRRGISDPQLKPQLREHSLKPACMPARFHPHTNLHSLCAEITVELLRFLAVPQSPLLQFPGLGIYKSDLLKARVIITTYNHHIRLLSPERSWLVWQPPKSTRLQEPTLSW